MTAGAQTGRRGRLAGVLADLAAEGDILDATVARLDRAGWLVATPAQGWDIAHQVAHLAWTDEVAVLAVTDPAAWEAVVLAAINAPDGFVDAAAAEGASADPHQLLERWRRSREAVAHTLLEVPDDRRIPWFGPPMSPLSMATARFMETWAHALDVADGLGRPGRASARLRHLVHLGVRTRDFAFSLHGLEPPVEEFRVELTSPDGAEQWNYGPQDAEQQVRGSAYDFALLVTQRRHRRDLDLVSEGPDAHLWLDIAQAFAGRPGAGRPAATEPATTKPAATERDAG
ncbi:MAG TPA: TIGR03084 family metal-binding protein [Nocardioidaceae bacterium]|nr:TIGR03084 family metal-binding protein [Nocardioidaceae bacterium]